MKEVRSRFPRVPRPRFPRPVRHNFLEAPWNFGILNLADGCQTLHKPYAGVLTLRRWRLGHKSNTDGLAGGGGGGGDAGTSAP